MRSKRHDQATHSCLGFHLRDSLARSVWLTLLPAVIVLSGCEQPSTQTSPARPKAGDTGAILAMLDQRQEVIEAELALIQTRFEECRRASAELNRMMEEPDSDAKERHLEELSERAHVLNVQAARDMFRSIDLKEQFLLVRNLSLLAEMAGARCHLELLDWDRPDFGARQIATADLADGHLNILMGGLNIFQYNPELTRRLAQEFGIRVCQIATCTDGERSFQFIDDYNAVSESGIDRRFGLDLIGRLILEGPTSQPDSP